MLSLFLQVLFMGLIVVQSANLIQNGDFETGILAPHWTTPLGTSNLGIISDTRCHGGLYCVRFGSVGSSNSILQSVTAVRGTSYTLSFWIYSDGGLPNEFIAQAQFTNGPLVNQFTIINAAPSNPFYFFSTIIVSPAGSIATNIGLNITFLGRNDPGYLVLDDVILEGIAGVAGDPQFMGLRGQSYQVHGIDGGIYNLVTSNTTQVNSQFVFLTDGVCPIIHDIPLKNCWSHAGSYLGEIGVQQIVNGVTHNLIITSGTWHKGFSNIELDGTPLAIGEIFKHSALFAINYKSFYEIEVTTEQFTFIFENSDMFINQIVSARLPLESIKAHGLLGQTHKRKYYNTYLKYIEGDVDDYLILENDIFGTSFVYNQFKLL